MQATMNMREAAEYIGVSYNTMANMVRKGKIPCYPIGSGRIKRFITAELERWMQNQGVKTMTKSVEYGKLRKID